MNWEGNSNYFPFWVFFSFTLRNHVPVNETIVGAITKLHFCQNMTRANQMKLRKKLQPWIHESFVDKLRIPAVTTSTSTNGAAPPLFRNSDFLQSHEAQTVSESTPRASTFVAQPNLSPIPLFIQKSGDLFRSGLHLPPESLKLNTHVQNVQGEAIPIASIFGNQLCVVVLLRHFGCYVYFYFFWVLHILFIST